MQDLKDYLRKGKSLDELWAVANGDIKYADFLHQGQGGNGKSNGKTAPPVPEDLVRSQPLRTSLDWQLWGLDSTGSCRA